jgi:hypothetical protein
MRAVKCKNGCLSIINRDEAVLFNKVEFNGFVDVNTLNEREQHIADEMYKRNVLRKVNKNGTIGFKTHAQKEKL